MKRARWFCHYFDNGEKKWSSSAGTRIAREAATLKNADGTPCFDMIKSYTKKDLNEKWVAAHSAHFAEKRGAGLWAWKPQVIRMTLDAMNDGDELLYCDTGCELRGSVEPIFQILQQQDVIAFELDIHYEYQWTKGDAFVAMKAYEHAQTKQRVGGISLFRKSALAYRVLDLWQAYCDQLQLVSPSSSKAPNLPGFREHRHDQSGWSLATKLCGVRALPDITWPLEQATIIAAARRQD